LKKKILTVGLLLIFTLGIMSGCGNENKTPDNTSLIYKDGIYSAEDETFSEGGWKEKVSITVENGNIISAYWTAVHKDGGDDKYVQSENGQYGMKEKANAKAEWHEQADLVTDYLVENQSVSGIKIKDGGKTDSVSGASISVGKFVELADKALTKAK